MRRKSLCKPDRYLLSLRQCSSQIEHWFHMCLSQLAAHPIVIQHGEDELHLQSCQMAAVGLRQPHLD